MPGAQVREDVERIVARRFGGRGEPAQVQQVAEAVPELRGVLSLDGGGPRRRLLALRPRVLRREGRCGGQQRGPQRYERRRGETPAG